MDAQTAKKWHILWKYFMWNSSVIESIFIKLGKKCGEQRFWCLGILLFGG